MITWMGGEPAPSINPNDFYVLAYPIQRQIDAAGVAARSDFFFNDLFTGNCKPCSGGFAGIFRFSDFVLRRKFFIPGNHINAHVLSCSAWLCRYCQYTGLKWRIHGGCQKTIRIERNLENRDIRNKIITILYFYLFFRILCSSRLNWKSRCSYKLTII